MTPLSPNERAVLQALAQALPIRCSSREIRKRVGLNRSLQGVIATVSGLVSKELVKRARYPNNLIVYHITKAGLEALTERRTDHGRPAGPVRGA